MIYSDFANEVVMDCPGVPVPVAIRSIREAVRTFCKGSTAYRKKLIYTDMVYSVGVYTITVPTGFRIESVISPMTFNGSYTVYTFSDGSTSAVSTLPIGTTLVATDNYTVKPNEVHGASPEWLDINRPGWRIANTSDTVDYFSMLTSNTFVLTPDNGGDRRKNITVTLVLMPDHTTTTVLDDEFCDRWFDHITAGAKYLLMVSPGTEWSNPNLAAFYKTKFEDGIEEAGKYIRTGMRNPQADGISHVRSYYK